MRQIFYTLALLAILSPSLAHSATLHVSKSGDGTDGSSWPNAFITISDAIQAATGGDEIWVASGTYNESVDFISGVSLYGGFIGSESPEYFSERDWKANETIIDATGLNNRCVRVAYVMNSLIDGFSIRNAFLDQSFARSGGGLFVINAYAEVSDCVFLDNRCAASGAAIATNDDNFFSQTTLRLKNCFFDRNIGNAVTTTRTQVYVNNCTFGLDNFQFLLDDYDDLDTLPTGGTADATVTNCIIRSHVRPGTEATFSNILEYPGEGNIDKDPLWVDPENGDYRLSANSPCIDAGTDVEVLNDLDGNPRPIDVKGRGIGRGFDMGCYEFQLKRADLNQDGSVNSEDLMMFQEEWMGGGRPLTASPSKR